MKYSLGANNDGITVAVGEHVSNRRVRNPAADQSQPKRNYVYAHLDESGTPFYVGKGIDRRAWTDDRHPLWHRYVEKHLNGKYSVAILEDDLTPDQAETLVNWINMSRPTDFKASTRYHVLRNANLAMFAEAKGKEKTNPEVAVLLYQQALHKLVDYASIQPDLGLVGKLIDDDITEYGLRGELQILDRLTLCLVRLGRGIEAKEAMTAYFAAYRRDAQLAGAQKIEQRVTKSTHVA